MKLLLERLTSTPRAYRFEASPGWWAELRVDALEHDYEVAEPYVFEFEAHTMGEDVHLAGRLVGAIDVECSRCLERYRHVLRDAYRLVLEPAGDRVPPDPEGVEMLEKQALWLGENLEAGWYRGVEIRLDAFFAERVSLAMPVQPLCREECAGLCPHCGIDRSRESCDCTDPKPESPFAALGALCEDRGGNS